MVSGLSLTVTRVTHYSPPELAAALGSGLLSFPVTPFRSDTLDVDRSRLREHLDWLDGFPVAGLFAAGGTGEVFSLEPAEVDVVVTDTVDAIKGRIPVIAPASGSTRNAVAQAVAADRAGADGILLFPPYLTEADPDGLYAHVAAVAAATQLGIILYSRANAQYTPALMRRLAAIPAVVGFKDGTGDLVALGRIVAEHGERLVYVGGVPTAEVLAQAYLAVGVTTYSSAMFNVMPEFAVAFYDALRAGDAATVRSALNEVVYPWLDIRDRRNGYAVSIVKSALHAAGRGVGPVRPPLTDLLPDELADLRPIIERATGFAA